MVYNPTAVMKAAKKAAKTEHKRQKKGGPPPPSPSAAERSASAAEKQVRLQQWRVVIAILTLSVAILAMLVTL